MTTDRRIPFSILPAAFDTLHEHFSLCALKTGTATATQIPLNGTDQFRADAERLSHIIMEMQRCFVLHLCKELAPGNVSFPQFFLLAALDQKEVLTMSAIAQKMGHTTAAASGSGRAAGESRLRRACRARAKIGAK